MTQHEMIEQYIRDFGSITTFDAYRDLGITKLSTRVSEMIRRGAPIIKSDDHAPNRYGVTVYFKRYFLGHKKDGAANV